MTQSIPFCKMQGLGNNYIYVDCLDQTIQNPTDLARKVSNVNFGIGSDGLILIHPSETADFRMQMFNADGSEGEMCGNGIRCVARYIHDNITPQKNLKIETLAGIRITELQGSQVKVDMGAPEIDLNRAPEEFPDAVYVSMGNPHLVIFVPDVTDDLVLGVGPKLEHHELYPNRINVEFIKVVDSSTLEMRVWERGSGETFACGTGACAAAVAANVKKLAGREVKVNLKAGSLDIHWDASDTVFMTGPAEYVCKGEFYA